MSKAKEEIRITNYIKENKEVLQNIADHLGLTLTAFLKMEHNAIREKYPKEMWLPVKKD